jgi:hypothetical protein
MQGNLIVVVQLGGLEPPTSCSTDRDQSLPSVRPIALEYELSRNFSSIACLWYAIVCPRLRCCGSYVVARLTRSSSNGFGKYHH